tara:strand:- start:26 stop:406 length:381 start_codon:yes stop_codon:yes gene_type:complete
VARRKSATRRRRRPQGIKLLNIAEGLIQANIVTSTLMDVNPIQFLVGDAGPTLMVGGGGMSLLEIAKNPDLLSTIGARAMNPENIINIAVKSAVANIGFKVAKRVTRRPVNLLNRQLKMLNLGVSF